MLKNIADAVLKELGIENDVPFQVNEWKDKDVQLWIKVKDGVSYWDCGSNKLNWCEDIVLLRQLMDGTLTVAKKVYTSLGVSFSFNTTTKNPENLVSEITKFVEKLYDDVIWKCGF